MSRLKLKLLIQLLSLPTAPFREEHIVKWVEKTLDRQGVPTFRDPYGNLVVGVQSVSAYKSLLRRARSEPVRLFIAHMDHPGFIGNRWLDPTRLEADWLGGSPVKHLANARVWTAVASGYLANGSLEKHQLTPSRRSIRSVVIRFKRPMETDTDPSTIFGGFGFRAPAWCQGNRIFTKAADDLVGVFAICATAIDLFRSPIKSSQNFLGLLTRGEEVGFAGAIKHLDLGSITARSRRVVAASLETSRALSNAIVGKGPVVRLGDRRTVFDPDALRVLQDVAENVLPGRHQRRVMDGGACEATAAVCWGLSAIGISVPLGNYHNECFGGLSGSANRGTFVEGAPAPEYVDLTDVDGLLRLCQGLMKSGLGWVDPWARQRDELRRRADAHQKYLTPKLSPRSESRRTSSRRQAITVRRHS